MDTSRECWDELRSLESAEPSSLAFRALIGLLDTWPAEDGAAAVAFADQFLAHWPDEARVAPWSWCKAASRGVVPVWWRLIRSLDLRPGHLTKRSVDLARLACRADLGHITELAIPPYSEFQEVSFLYHRPEVFPNLRKLLAQNKSNDGEVRALSDSPLWQGLESFGVNRLTDSLAHEDVSRIVPRLDRRDQIQHISLRALDLMELWDRGELPRLRSADLFVRSIDEARRLAGRAELRRLESLTLAFRCGFNGGSPFAPFLGNVIEADEAAAEAFFSTAELDRLEGLAIVGYPMGTWGREGMGRLGLGALISSGLLRRLKRLRCQSLPLGDEGVAALAPSLGEGLESLELVDVYCKGAGAAALANSPCLGSLRTLDLSGNRIDADGFVRLAGAAMPRLEALDLSGPNVNPYYWFVGQQPMTDRGAVAWAESVSLMGLRSLRMANCYLTDDAMRAVFRSPRLRGLKTLDLSHNSFSDGAISEAVVGSALWNTLVEVGLNDCRLDDAAVEALARVREATELRSLELAYNSVGPRGATALASWPALAGVWRLHLHDNFIGDDGLIALTQSPYLGRLVELDLEQDCWNSRTFTFGDRAAQAFADSPTLTRLDALFSGCVDEYHGCAYSPGFSKRGLEMIRNSGRVRAALRASCGDFSGIGDYFEPGEFDPDRELEDHDFRQSPFMLQEGEAEPGRRAMQQLRSADQPAPAFDFDAPPKIQPVLADVAEEPDIIEGIAFRDPAPVTDVDIALELDLRDARRPLPKQVGKLLRDILDSLFKSATLGNFQANGSSSTTGEGGRPIYTSESFSLAFNRRDAEKSLRLVREALWWLGAPEGTDLEEFPLRLSEAPAEHASHFVQFAVPKISRWKSGNDASHRIDRVPFALAQRQGICNILAEFGTENDGRVGVATADGGRIEVFAKYLDDSDEIVTLNVLIEQLTPDVSNIIFRIMEGNGMMLFPMAFAANAEVAALMEGEWPGAEIAPSAEALHELLAAGPYARWRERELP